MTCEADASDARTRGPCRASEWAAEAFVYAMVAIAALSRGNLPDLSHYVLALALGLSALLPPFLMSDRSEAGVLGRFAAAMCVGLLLIWRAPVPLPLTLPSPRGEELRASLCALASLGLIIALVADWRRRRPPLPWCVLAVVGGVFAFAVVVWPLLDWGLSLDPENEAMGLQAALRSLSATLQYGAVLAYMLTVEPLSRRRRLSLVAAAALAVRLALPASVGGG